MKPIPVPAPPRGRAWLLAVGWLACGPALALYKVEMPDGSVTYTDRPPIGTKAKITTLGANAVAVAPGAALPLALRQPAQRYPVTLYTSAECSACEDGRRMLQQRGIPYSERLIATDDDAQALERAIGARIVPALTIGAQGVRGYSQTEWAAYLDAAGYPRDSLLPPTWQAPEPRPMVERSTVARRAPAAAAPAAPPPTPVDSTPAPGTLRF